MSIWTIKEKHTAIEYMFIHSHKKPTKTFRRCILNCS